MCNNLGDRSKHYFFKFTKIEDDDWFELAKYVSETSKIKLMPYRFFYNKLDKKLSVFKKLKTTIDFIIKINESYKISSYSDLSGLKINYKL